MQTDRSTRFDNATDTEKRLSQAVADELGIEPTYTDDFRREWPIVQCRDQYENTYAFWLDEYGALGTVTDREGTWATAYAQDGTMIEEGYSDVRKAALAVQELENDN